MPFAQPQLDAEHITRPPRMRFTPAAGAFAELENTDRHVDQLHAGLLATISAADFAHGPQTAAGPATPATTPLDRIRASSWPSSSAALRRVPAWTGGRGRP